MSDEGGPEDHADGVHLNDWSMFQLWLDTPGASEPRDAALVTTSLARPGRLLLVNPLPMPLDELHRRVVEGVNRWRPFGHGREHGVEELEVMRVVLDLGYNGGWVRGHQPQVLSAVSPSTADCLAGLLELLAVITTDRTVMLYEYPSGRLWEQPLPQPRAAAAVVRLVAAWTGAEDDALQWLLTRALDRHSHLRSEALRSPNPVVRALGVGPDDPLKLLTEDVIRRFSRTARMRVARRDDLDMPRLECLLNDEDDLVRELVVKRLHVPVDAVSGGQPDEAGPLRLNPEERRSVLSAGGHVARLAAATDMSTPFGVVVETLGTLKPSLVEVLLQRADRDAHFLQQQLERMGPADEVLRLQILGDLVLPTAIAEQYFLRAESQGELVVLAGRHDIDVSVVASKFRDLYDAANPTDRVQLLSIAGMPASILTDVVEGNADPALVGAAVTNPDCPHRLLLHALFDTDATVRLEAVEALHRRDLAAPVAALQQAMRLPVAGRPSNLQVVKEFSPSSISDLGRVLLARPAERAEAQVRLRNLQKALVSDVLFAMSQSAQELFHSNTWAWLVEHVPHGAQALLALFGSRLEPGATARVWREHHYLDLLIDPGELHPRVVIKNTLFTVPTRKLLARHCETPLPWSNNHGQQGAEHTEYVLVGLLPPSFPLPRPWSYVSYDDLSTVVGGIAVEHEGDDWPLLSRYAELLRRLADFSTAVDPRFRSDESFFQWQPDGLDFDQEPLAGIVQKIRYSGLVQMIHQQLGSSGQDFEVNFIRGTGLVSYHRKISATRTIGWQLLGDQFRLFVRIYDVGLHGSGARLRDARAAVAERDHGGWFNFSAGETLLGSLLRPRRAQVERYLQFDPDFVYQARSLDRSITTLNLVRLLAEYTELATD